MKANAMLLKQQDRNFLALVQAMKGTSTSQELRQSEFDPDKGNVDARAWISTADMCIQDPELQGVGHYASECLKRPSHNPGGNSSGEATSFRSTTEKRADVCIASPPTGTLC